ncbi:unnamed protein product [Cochlearia groenlandica]
MEFNEDKQAKEKMIPVFTVLKNGAILKNIFVVSSRDFSSPERNDFTVSDDDYEAEEILLVGRHPDCDVMLTHPSISRFHLRIRSIPSLQKLFVTDLSSVHGTWVTDLKVEPNGCVEVKEGDVIRIGGSTRIYRLHWIPLSRAYDTDSPFVSPLDASTAEMEQEEEDKEEDIMLDTENLEVAEHQIESVMHSLQPLSNTASSEDGDLHLDSTSEGTGSSIPSEDEDTDITMREIPLPIASPTLLALPATNPELEFNEDSQTLTNPDLDVAEAVSEKPSSSGSPIKQQHSGEYSEGLCCSGLEFVTVADEFNDRGDGSLHLNAIWERIESPVVNEDPYLAAEVPDSTETGTLQITEDVQADAMLLEANSENPSSGFSPSKEQIDGCFEASGCSPFELASEVEILAQYGYVSDETEFDTQKLTETSAEHQAKAEIQIQENNGVTEVSRQVDAVSPHSFSQAEPTLEVLTEEAQDLVVSEFKSKVAIVTESENLYQIGSQCNEETKVGSSETSVVYDCSFARKERLLGIITEDCQSLCSSWQPLLVSEAGLAPSKILSEMKHVEDQNQISGMTRNTEKLFDDGSSSSLSESGTQSLLLTPVHKPITEFSFGSERSEEHDSESKTEGKANTEIGSPILSALAADTFEHTMPFKEVPSDDTGSQESQTAQTRTVRDEVLSEMDNSGSSSLKLSTSNIWSRRGKDASVLQLRINKSEGKQKQLGNQPKAQLRKRQVLNDKSLSLNVHHVAAEKLEPEIFTPDKENLTPTSHMLKRLHDIGDIKDSKSSSKLSGKPSSSKIFLSTITSGAFSEEPEIFTPDKENLTPYSHMLKRLQEVGEVKETKGSSSKLTRKPFFDMLVEENAMAEQKPDQSSMKVKHELMSPKKKAERVPFQPLLEKSSSETQSYTEASLTVSARNSISRRVRSSSILSDAKSKTKWTIVLDTSTILDKESRKPLHLLQGLKGTQLIVPRTVLRELNETKLSRGFLSRRRREIASSALDWIEECKVNTKWWIQLQSTTEETKATAQTPPVTPMSYGYYNYAPEIDSPTSEDQALECALLYRNRNIDEKLVILSNDVTLKVKAMAEGVICETAREFHESLANPLSERFMWKESLPRGRTWSHRDDVASRERYKNRNCATAKGLKLILLHNSHYGNNQ